MTFFVEGLSKHLEPQVEVRRIGEYKTVVEAIVAAQRRVDEFLERERKPDMDARTLVAHYQNHGEHPYIFRDNDNTFNVPGFNHLHYAMKRAAELCGGEK